MTQEEYNFATLIINSLSALGTFTASGIALWIALRQTKMQLQENAQIKISLCRRRPQGESSIFINIVHLTDNEINGLIQNIFMQISIYNKGIKDFYLKSIAFSSTEDNYLYYLPDSFFLEKYSEKKISSGNSYALHIPLDTILRSFIIVEIYKKMKKPKKSFHIVINTTMESVFLEKVPPELHMYLSDIVRVTTPSSLFPQD